MRDSMTFYDLHRVIQSAFEWMDSHLHGFDIMKTNSVRVDQFNAIGPSDTEEFGFVDYKGNEEEVQLREVFKKEKDKVLYTYDYGDNWEHEIVLEKVLTEETGTFYPRCTRALREAPEEDSRFFYLETGIQTEEVDPKELMEFINEAFRDEFNDHNGKLQDTNYVKTEVDKENGHLANWFTLLENVDRYKQLQPWKWVDDDQIFVVVDPVTKEYVYCSIMGGSDIEYGLAVYIGEEGLRFLNGLIHGLDMDESYYLMQRSLLLSFCNRDELSKEDIQILKDHGKTYRGKNQWPLLRSFVPGFYPWFLEEEEVRLFSLVIEQVIQVSLLAKKGAIEIDPYSEKMFGREFDQNLGVWKNIQVIESNKTRTVKSVQIFTNELEIQELKKNMKRNNIVVEFDCDYLFTPLQDGGHNERPYYPMLTLGLERKNGLVVYHEMSKTTDFAEDVQKSLLGLVKQLQCIPREIWVKEEIAHSIKPIAKKLNIQLMVVRSLPLVESARKEMEMMFTNK